MKENDRSKNQGFVPAPPPIRRFPARLSPVERSLVAATAGAMLLVFTAAWWVNPNPEGYGTHTQLGLPPCNMERFLGLPCPFCGMTTAFALMMRGEIQRALEVQPAGVALFGIAVLALLACLAVAVTGRTPRTIGARPDWLRWLGLLAVAILSASWIYKIMATR